MSDKKRKSGEQTTEFKAMVGGSIAVMLGYLVGKIWPGSGVQVSDQELVLGITGMVSAYMTVRGWVKSAEIKADRKDD